MQMQTDNKAASSNNANNESSADVIWPSSGGNNDNELDGMWPSSASGTNRITNKANTNSSKASGSGAVGGGGSAEIEALETKLK